jgi:rare lipoprotein A
MSQRKLWKPLAASLAIVTLGAATPATAQEAVPSSGAQPLLNAAQVLDGADFSKTDTELPEAAIAATPLSPRPVASSITELYEYEIEGRDAVTLYVRNIPIATFVAVDDADAEQEGDRPSTAPGSTTVEGATPGDLTAAAGLSDRPQACADVVRSTETGDATQAAGTSCAEVPNSVRARANAAAERINEFYRAGHNASEIQLQWDGQNTQYQVLADNTALLVVDAGVTGPEPTPSLSDDALQVTNRLRRQIGNAPPLVYEGQRRSRAAVFGGSAVDTLGGEALGASTNVAVRSIAEGYASWYGPGFHGRRTASGEVFNQNAMTAAHRTLPFGTRVRVTNLNNGQSAVVRITDRGPFIHNRIVDLSAQAARAVGLYSAGVGRVRLEILAE